jgi:hypothetical protein
MDFLGILLAVVIFAALWKGLFYPDTSSTSYRLGKGLGNKTRKLGEWIMKDD